MAAEPNIPRADGKFQLFAEAFCNNISADPARYMMVPAEAASLMRWFNEFNAALKTARSPGTRTRGAIANKDDARSILEDAIRKQAAFIKINDGITDGDKLGIGVQPRNVSHHKRVCPNTPPLLKFIGSLPGIDELRYHHTNTPTSPARPYGAARLELWVAYSGPGEPRPKVSEARPVGSFTKSKMLVSQDFDMLARGLRPTYYARWAGYNDNKGPNVSEWSLPVSMVLAIKALRKQKQANDDRAADASLKMTA